MKTFEELDLSAIEEYVRFPEKNPAGPVTCPLCEVADAIFVVAYKGKFFRICPECLRMHSRSAATETVSFVNGERVPA